MTAEEKAKDLVIKFEGYAYRKFLKTDEFGYSIYESYTNAKQCALIAVDEIMKEVLPIGARSGNERHLEIYWQQVKEEINKL